MQRMSVEFDLTEKDVRIMTERAQDMGLTLKQLMLLAIATGVKALTEVDMLNVDPLQALADDLEGMDEG